MLGKIIALILVGMIPVRAAIAQPGQVFLFFKCSAEISSQLPLAEGCWQAHGQNNGIWIIDTSDFNCGTAGCTAMLYHQLEKPDDTLTVQCEQQNEHSYKCFSYTETYRFNPFDKRLLAESYQNPYISRADGNNYLIMEMSEACFMPAGCAVFNYTLQNGHYLRGYPFVEVVCNPVRDNEDVICETKSKFADTH